MSQTVLEFNNISKTFYIKRSKKTLFRFSKTLLGQNSSVQTIQALRNISFKIIKGDKIAVIGRNGAGKTTLFRIASKIFLPTSGTLHSTEEVLPLFKYGLGMNPFLPVIENIFIIGAFYGLHVKDIRDKLESILEYAELKDALYQPVNKLSSGQLQRLCFSIFLSANYSFMVFDESMSFADANFQNKMSLYFKKIMSGDQTMLMASHSADQLKRYCKKAIWLEAGEIKQIGDINEITLAYSEYCKKNDSLASDNISRES